ncbi:MAG: phosphoribosylanthranilate isomerase [Chloroflexi bacterium]|nr:MAG: phosphoribosylanthranilate isomerase [Chloroflexota bacterium]TME40147.1 MAG: phosphoribosylanthranilate isomerase [Chloroflexota bacterium]TME50228.1 MAG: phosphoribosylanthranilate isomerase [Chloroflexota bacterium]
MIRIKICGICDLEGASAAVEAGADMIGFHFCSSDRHVTPEEALAILDELSVRPKVVGVFIDQPAEEVRQIAEYLDLDLLQLHGSEPAGFDAGRPVMKVLKVKDGVLPDAEQWPDPIMLDSWSADQRGGTGRTWDWDLARPLLAARQVFVAGGLEPGNVGKVVSGFKPYGVDVSSGVEARVRVKDPEKVRAFIRAVRLAEVHS